LPTSLRRKCLAATCAGVMVVSIGLLATVVRAELAKVDPTALPVGDNKYSLTTAARDSVFLCRANGGGPGAMAQGPWFNGDGTYNSKTKVTVDGDVEWPQARVSIVKNGTVRSFSSNDLPVNHNTGNYPIAPSDDAYQYDRNPSAITEQDVAYELPGRPVKGAPRCMGGQVGVATNGVEIYNPFDAQLRDANAWEAQDACGGHPNQNGYHYHSIPACLYEDESRKKQSGLVGFAFDGFPIYGPRGKDGRLLTNKDLDVCHGTTSKVKLDGKKQRIYHYVATKEFPYVVGCFRGTTSAPGSPG